MFAAGFVDLYTADTEAGVHFYRDLLGLDGNPVEIVPKVA
jgi:hypothetical protein